MVACSFLLAASLFAQQKEVPAPQSTAKAATPVLAVKGSDRGRSLSMVLGSFAPATIPNGRLHPSMTPAGSRCSSMAHGVARVILRYTGYAWYRRHVQIHTLAGSQTKYALADAAGRRRLRSLLERKADRTIRQIPAAAALVLLHLPQQFSGSCRRVRDNCNSSVEVATVVC